MKTFSVLLLLITLLTSCDRGEDDPAMSLEILRPVQGQTITADEPVEIEININAVDVIDKVLFIANKQNIATPDTILNQTLQQSGNFSLTHNHTFQHQGGVSLQIEVFSQVETPPQAVGTVNFTVQ